MEVKRGQTWTARIARPGSHVERFVTKVEEGRVRLLYRTRTGTWNASNGLWVSLEAFKAWAKRVDAVPSEQLPKQDTYWFQMILDKNP